MPSPAGQSADQEVRCGIAAGIGVILLNRPQALNALSLPMIRTIRGALENWRRDDAVRMIVLKASGKAFCAGGDIRAVRAASLAGEDEQNRAFFSEEYALNAAIHRYPKPYLSLIDGVCMGGGMGLSVHGRYRVVTERAVMAMPETAIGFFPDIGASHFLSSLPGALGLYLGLTGARLEAADALHSGLATHFVAADRLAPLEEGLARGTSSIDDLLDRFAGDAGPRSLPAQRSWINRYFGERSVEAIIDALAHDQLDWARQAFAALRAASPESLRITTELVRWAKGRSLEECLERELQMALSQCRSPDFLEGVRAMLVDKDRTPRWQSRLADRPGRAVSEAP